MPNQWGTQLSVLPPAYVSLIGGANVPCPSGTETNVAQVNLLTAFGPGNYAPQWQGVLNITLGATAPSALTFACRIGAGSDIYQVGVPTTLLVANASLWLPVFLCGVTSASLWYPAGAVWNLTVNPSTQAVTAVNAFSVLFYSLLRGQDL